MVSYAGSPILPAYLWVTDVSSDPETLDDFFFPSSGYWPLACRLFEHWVKNSDSIYTSFMFVYLITSLLLEAQFFS